MTASPLPALSYAIDTAAPPAPFDYNDAFSRTIGFVTPDELQVLRRSKVAIAGMGGVGGIHLQTLTRLGIGAFNIADFDHFEMHNFNRQNGATMRTLHQQKAAVMDAMARDINPELSITIFDAGVTPENIDQFLDGVDLYIDGLDFFAFDARERVFAACAQKNIPAITVAPLGMSAALMIFLPGKMTFEQYFCWKGQDNNERALRLLAGLAPKATHRHYLVWPSAINLSEHKGSSTPMACSLCAGIAATEALKILLKRGSVQCAPHSIVFDAYTNRVIHSVTRGGMNSLVSRLRLAIMRTLIRRMEAQQKARRNGDMAMG